MTREEEKPFIFSEESFILEFIYWSNFGVPGPFIDLVYYIYTLLYLTLYSTHI